MIVARSLLLLPKVPWLLMPLLLPLFVGGKESVTESVGWPPHARRKLDSTTSRELCFRPGKSANRWLTTAFAGNAEAKALLARVTMPLASVMNMG